MKREKSTLSSKSHLLFMDTFISQEVKFYLEQEEEDFKNLTTFQIKVYKACLQVIMLLLIVYNK